LATEAFGAGQRAAADSEWWEERDEVKDLVLSSPKGVNPGVLFVRRGDRKLRT
jgi:hypothetical protein